MTDKKKEKIKDFVLVVLFVLTILLLYLYLDKKSAIKIKDFLPSAKEETYSIDAKDYIVPGEIRISNGDGSYKKAKLSAESFKSVCAYFATVTKQGNAMIAEVSEEQYRAAVKNYASVQYILNYDIPFSDFCTEYSIKRSTGFGSVENVRTIAYSTAAKDSILLYDATNNSYYRFISEMEIDTGFLLENTELLTDNYFIASEILGTEGDALVPIGDKPELLNAKCEAEITPEMEQKRTEISENIFGETYDFVRRISDSFGNIMYIYGYGQKSLNFYENGTIEYRSEAGSESGTGFFEDLSTVISGIEELGGYNNADNPYISLVLSSVTSSDNGKQKTRTFIFSQIYNDCNVYGDAQPAVEAVVSGGQLVYLKRNVISLTQIYKGESFSISAIDAIANSSPDMYSGRLKNIQIAYYDKDGDMTPVYAITLNDGSVVIVNMKGEVLD